MGRCYRHLSAEERGALMVMRRSGQSIRRVAAALGRAPSTLSRELRRNGAAPADGSAPSGRPRTRPGYDAQRAGARARRLRHRPRRARKLARRSVLWARVCAHLRRGWSPEQIAGRLGGMSAETIYTAIYAMPRGHLADLPSIHLRPPEADERLLPGHWEGDLLIGAHNRSAVGVLVDRYSLFVILVKLDGTTAEQALAGFSRAFAPLPPELRKTLTYDQGKEMALHRALAEGAGLDIYFADPHSPWQRGICENTNGLLRQYLPKGTDLSVYSQRELDAIAWNLDTRPRKSMGFNTPAEVFFERCFDRRPSEQ
jgi:transposase, IS30 family